MYKGVIFDLDGTLVNSIEDIKNSLNRVLKKNGYKEKSLNDYTNNIGQGLYQLTDDSLDNKESKQIVDKLYQELLADYAENYLVDTKPYPGMIDLLNDLVARKILIGVNSNKKDEFTKVIVKTLFKDIPFVLVLGDRLNINKKPDPYSANEIIEKMNLDKSEVVYIGDTDHDIKTAKNANIASIGVTWGYRSKEVLIASGANEVVDNVADLRALLINI